ncbi:unnamed protein product [Rhizoctonia solani]|uniref:Uncharacterized protein n=1 Tax=Rhizoctonia solani TaxID=456999 RepID=A0A8H2X0P9_9AGAM|nr:unnamed protein product [Rhizoctonia solani]
MTTRAWIPRTPTLDYESDHQPSPIHPMYHDHEQSPADTWLSPAMASNDDVEMMFELDFNRPDAFCSLLDDTASRREQHAILQRWHAPGYSMPSKSKAKANSSISPVDKMTSPTDAPAVPESYAPPTPTSPAVKLEAMDDVLDPPRASPALKRPFDDVESQVEAEADADLEPVTAGDDVASEAEYAPPSEDEEDDADPTYGAPKTRRTSHSIHARTSLTSEKPVRTGPGRRRRPVDDTAPSQCTYISPLNQSRCQQIFARAPEMKRHIDHFHHEQEARAVIDGRLSRDMATLLGDSWDGTLGKPTCEGCGTEFSRRDAVKRHQNEVKAKFEDGRCVWCPGTQGRKGSAKRVALAKLSGQTPTKKPRRK